MMDSLTGRWCKALWWGVVWYHNQQILWHTYKICAPLPRNWTFLSLGNWVQWYPCSRAVRIVPIPFWRCTFWYFQRALAPFFLSVILPPTASCIIWPGSLRRELLLKQSLLHVHFACSTSPGWSETEWRLGLGREYRLTQHQRYFRSPRTRDTQCRGMPESEQIPKEIATSFFEGGWEGKETSRMIWFWC